MRYLPAASLDLSSLGAQRRHAGVTFSLLIPARGEDALESLGTIIEANVARWMNEQDVLHEIGVSIDPDPAHHEQAIAELAMAAGASWVVFNRDVIHRHAPGEKPGQAGKAANVRTLALLATGDRLIFHDSDLTDYDAATVGNLVAASLSPEPHDGDLPLFVNGASKRATSSGGAGGRTTEMLRALFSKQLYRHVPEYVELMQPLLGEFMIDAELFAVLPFARGYGIETALKALAIDAVGARRVAQVELPIKTQNGQAYTDLVKQLHEISFTVDILEEFFNLRTQGVHATPSRLAEQYYDRHPNRAIELHRPEGYDEVHFTPRMGFYEPLATVEHHRLRYSGMDASIFEMFSSVETEVVAFERSIGDLAS